MGLTFSRPLSPEQIKERERKKAELVEEERKTQNDLITAYLLEKIAQLEANQNDGN